MTDLPFSSQGSDPKFYFQQKRERTLSSQKSHELSNDTHNGEHAPSTSQLLLVPNRSNPDSIKGLNRLNAMGASNLSLENHSELRPKPLIRRSSNTSYPSEGTIGTEGRPLSGISSKRGKNTKNRQFIIRSNYSPAKSGTINQSRSMGRPEETSIDTHSYSFSGLHQIHQMYQDLNENGSRLGMSAINSSIQRRRGLASKVKDTYYKLLRKRFARRKSYVEPDTREFHEQMEYINENVRIPNEERIADIKLEEMTMLERAEKYKDKYPFLEQRRKIMKTIGQINFVSFKIISHPIFDICILIVIIINSILLALSDPTEPQSDSFNTADNYFLAIYTLEMVLKIFGLGFILNRHSYLRDPWNILDFFIVVTSYLPLVLSSSINLRAFRALRVIRPLKTISSIDSLRIIVLTLLAAMKPLLETLFILFFLFLIFAIAGLQLFSGSLKKRCFSVEEGFPLQIPDQNNILQQQYCINDDNCGTINGVFYICGKMIANPDYGTTNFDNIGSAFLMAFQIVTMEGWSDIMQNLQRTFSPLSAIYFVVLIFIGSFFFLNLTLAIIKAEFTAHSRTSIAARRIKKPTYDERLVIKLRENKQDVLKLLHKHHGGDALYNKYQFKKDQLIAVENSRVSKLGKPIRKRRDALKTPPHTPQATQNPGFQFMSALLRLRKTISRVNPRASSMSTIFPESKTDVASLNDVGSLNNFDKESTKIKARSFGKVHPSDDKGSQQELLNTSIDNISPSPSPLPSKLKKFFQGFNRKPNFVQKRTTEPSSGSVAEPQFTPRATPSNSEEANYQFKSSPRSEYKTSSEQQSNVQIFKQQRGFGDLKIKITEPTTSNDEAQNEDEGENNAVNTDNPVIRPFNHHNLPSSVPSVIEEEASEISPAKSSISSPYKRRTKRDSRTKRIMKLESGPVRPLMDEKIKLKADELSGNEIKMINIAGIRNKQNNQTQIRKKQQDLENQELTKAEQQKREEIEDEIIDHMNDDEWFLEFLKAQEATGTVPSKNTQAEALLKKINQIKGLTDSQRRSLVRAARSVSGSERDSLMKNSYKLSSVIASEDFEGNFSKNSHSRRKNSSLQRSSKGFFEDSDFLEGRRRNSKSGENSQKPKNFALRRKNTLAKRGLRRGMTIKEEAEFNEEQEDGIEGNKMGQRAVELENIITEEDVIAIEEIERHMVVDLRRLKAEPLKERVYESNSLDDVLPSKKENEKKRQEDDERQKLRDHRLKINYQVTRGEEAAALERKAEMIREQKTAITSIAIIPNPQALQVRRQEEEEKRFDEEINAALESMKAKGNVKSNWSMKLGLKRFGVKNKNNRGKSPEEAATPIPKFGNKALRKAREAAKVQEQEEELTDEQMKDFFFLLRKIQTPYDNEKEFEDSQELLNKMKVFEFPEEYRNIRRKDLEENKILNSNWSGNTVLPLTYNEVPVDRIKKSLNLQDWDIWRPGVLGIAHGFRRKIRSLIQSTLFNAIVLISVFLNTIVLASNGLIRNETVNQVFSHFNTAFIIIFAIEMGLKIIALGITKYTRDLFNIFDAIIVVISVVETIMDSDKNSAISAFRTLRLLRTLRILRVTKLLRSLSFMKIIIGIGSRSIQKFLSVLVVLLLLIFIYTLLGMQLFGGQLYYSNNFGDNRIRQNFDSFINAFLTVFQIMTQENWHNILHLVYRSSVNKILSISYLVSWILIGNYIFLNLFLALLLDEFTSEEVEEELEEIEKEEEALPIVTQASNLTNMTKKSSRFSQKTVSKDSSRLRSISSLNSASLSLTDFDGEKEEPFIMFKDVGCNRSLYIFSKFNPTRKACYVFAKHHRFEMFILAIIFVSCIKLILDTYIPRGATTLSDISIIFDYIFLAIFVIEAMAKIIGSGFVLDKNSYLRDGWNVLDFIIVIASIIDVTFQSYNLSAFKVLRLLRTLRPLRFISHNQNMRIVVIALLESVGAMLNVLLVVFIIWLMFAILAVNLVGGQFGYCSGLPAGVSYYRISFTQCNDMGYKWENFNANFDNVFHGLLTLFISSTQENWPNLMYQMVDSNTPDKGPIENSNRLLGNLYFIIFIFIGSYFLVNLFIGVIFLNFTRAHQEVEFRHKFLTPHQRKWVAVQRLVLFTKPDVTMVEPTKKWMMPYFRLISHKYFEYFIMGSIILNILTMGLNYDDSSPAYSEGLNYVNYMFTGIFVVEMILKNLGLGFRKYWSSDWNKLDTFIVAASVLDLILGLMNTSIGGSLNIGPQLVRVFRVLRVVRLLKLIKRFKGLKKIINTLVFSLPSLLNIGALLGLIYFIFAIMATFLFKDIEKGEVIGDHIHFKDFLTGILTLFRCSTGEDWWGVMFDTLYPAQCVQGVTTCGTKAAIPFFVIYILLCQFIFLNLFILIVIQQFEEYHLNPSNPVNRFREKLEGEFNPTWQLLSAKYQGTQIHEKQLIPFFMSLNPPLGFRNLDLSKKEVALEITQMNLTSNSHGMIFYNDVLHACMKRIYGNEDLVGNPKYLVKEEVKVKRKLEQIKKQLSFARTSSNVTPGLSKNNAQVNPIFRMLFAGMTMKAWLNYSKRVAEKMKAAQENGFEYIPSESDEDDYTEIHSEEDSFSSHSSHGNYNENVGDIYDENEHHEEAEHISEEGSEDENAESGSEEPKEERSVNKSERIKPTGERENYKWVIHKDIPSLNTSPFKGFPIDPMESSERFLLQGNFGTKTPICLSESPKKEGRIDSVWDGSPERISTSQILKTEGGAHESPKSIFDFLDAEKLSNISPTSKRNSVREMRDDFYHGLFEQNPSQNLQHSNIFINKTPTVDSNILIPPSKKDVSFGLKLSSNRAQAAEMYEKAEKDFLNIPLSLSRNISKASDGMTPKSATVNEKFFPAE